MTTVGDILYQMGGVPVNSEFTTGTIFFVDDSGSNSNEGTDPNNPVATLDYAIGLCTVDRGDIIYVMPGHAESASGIACDVAGIKIIGLGHGLAMPTITSTVTAADLVAISADSTWIENIRLIGNTSCTALVNFAAAADNSTLKNCSLESGAAPVDQVTIAATCNYGTIENCKFIGTAAGLANCILFEQNAAGVSQDCANWTITGCIFNASSSAGCDDACIMISISSGGVTGILISDCMFLGLADADAAINGAGVSSCLGDGLVVRAMAQALDPSDSFILSTNLGWVDCHTVSIGTHSYGSVAGAARHPRLTPTA